MAIEVSVASPCFFYLRELSGRSRSIQTGAIENMSVYDPVLVCPSCEAARIEIVPADETTALAELKCDACSFSRMQSPTSGFFDLRLNEVHQDRSLFVHQLQPSLQRQLPVSRSFRGRSYAANRDILRMLVGSVAPNITIDVGCGPGNMGTELRNICGSYYGLDPSDIPDEYTHFERGDARVLVHFDPDRPLPLQDRSADLIVFIASYDQIPNACEVLPEYWSKLRPGGHLIILMTNYGSWAKRLVNWVSRRKRFTHADIHFRVHTPTTLEAEIGGLISDAIVERVDADYWFAPNIPGRLGLVYSFPYAVDVSNMLFKACCTGLGLRHAGTTMAVMFQKRAHSVDSA